MICSLQRSVQAVQAEFPRSDVIVTQLEIPLSAVKKAAELAHQARKPFVLNPAPARPLPKSLLRLVHTVTPNEHEAAILTGERSPEQRRRETAGSWLPQCRDHSRRPGRHARERIRYHPVSCSKGQAGRHSRCGRLLYRLARHRNCRRPDDARLGDASRAGCRHRNHSRRSPGCHATAPGGFLARVLHRTRLQ